MVWLEDPELFMDYLSGHVRLWRLKKTFGSPLKSSDFSYETESEDYLTLVGDDFPWKKNDFEAFASLIYRNDLLVNCQGVVLPITYPRDRDNNDKPDQGRAVYFWSHEVVNMSRYGLPIPSVPFREVKYIGGGIAPVDLSPKENELALNLAACIEERDREKAEKQALAIKVARLEATISNLKSKNYLFNQKNM
ncbi:hypothetical protein MKX01_001383 [Papaver californicum]|nr:hypothetical protein MKX01_001383 [Papaver californicum]